MALSWKQAQAFGSAVRHAAGWLQRTGGKAVGTPKGQYVVKTSAKKIYKLAKGKGFKRGLEEVLKKGPGIASDVALKTWLAKPKLSLDEAFTKYVKDFKFKHGNNPKVWAKRKVKLMSMEEWAATKVPGKDYKGPMPHFDQMGGFIGQKATGRLWKKVVAGGAFAGAGITAIGHAADKGNVQGYAESPSGRHRIEGHSKLLRVSNPEGKGGQWSAGGAVRVPGGVAATGGFNVGIGHAKKAGLAHQIGGHLHIATPFGKTGFKAEEQHAFGIKSRSRRVAAIRRATFGSEQHLGVTKKPTKAQRAKDSLY